MRARIAERPRRRYRRRTVRVEVEYACDAGLRSDPATTLGAGGMFLESDSPLPEGSRLQMRFRLPGGQQTHEIEGRVVWRRADRNGSGHGMGIEFTDRAAAVKLAQELEGG